MRYLHHKENRNMATSMESGNVGGVGVAAGEGEKLLERNG